MSTHPHTFLTPEEYLEIERKAEFKSEYYRGEMFAMAGASRAHNLIAINAVSELRETLRRGPCEVYSHDMRVWIPDAELFTYPDIVIVCDKPQFAPDKELDTLLNPVVVVEVLSPSTETFDRSEKFKHYGTIPSFREYLLLASNQMYAELFTRQPDGKWLLSFASGGDETIEFSSIECRLVLKNLYEKVEFGMTGPVMRPLHR